MANLRQSKALLNLFANVASAATKGLSAAKPVQKGCGSCKEKSRRRAGAVRTVRRSSGS